MLLLLYEEAIQVSDIFPAKLSYSYVRLVHLTMGAPLMPDQGGFRFADNILPVHQLQNWFRYP